MYEPFIKWVGGKRQLITEIEKHISAEIKQTKIIDTYIEPFIGGGALFFYLQSNYTIKNAIICDINTALINAYLVVQQKPAELNFELEFLQNEYLPLEDDERKEYFAKIKQEYNQLKQRILLTKLNQNNIKLASYFIFLNRTGFNGLYRENKKGEYNVPIGRYKKPAIYNPTKILNASEALQNTKIYNIDFNQVKELLKNSKNNNAGGLIYYDPPYRPISNTASFKTYTNSPFNDNEQENLKDLFEFIAKKYPNYQQILSNSYSIDGYFQNLYKEFDIFTVNAKRNINSKGSGRGEVKEILVIN